ncbi:MAG TPA: hypothetical protein VFA68_01640 [Terriglobales bacterium]|nr:hypothetical protein [Terriglobales bacterium]
MKLTTGRDNSELQRLKADAQHSLQVGELGVNERVGELPDQSCSNMDPRPVSGSVQLRLDELRVHPSYARHHVAVPAPQMAVLEALGDFAFREPIVITRDRIVVDGYARWQLARHQGRDTILCTEYDLSEEESLRWLVQSRRPYRGLNAYTRIILALDAEPYLQDKARANLRLAGKGSSNLTDPSRVDVRSQVAAIAGVSAGNVTKVKQLRKTVAPAIEQAVRDGEISIHRAWLWSYENPQRQVENLRLWRLEKGIKAKAKALVTQHQSQLQGCSRDPRFLTLPELEQLVAWLSANSEGKPIALKGLVIATVDVPGPGIFISRDFVEDVKEKHKGLPK